MLKTYLTIAYRNFIRNKVFSLINVLGLSIGISASLVIFLIVHYDFSFDNNLAIFSPTPNVYQKEFGKKNYNT